MQKNYVLVVDDDEATRQLICSVLEASGVSCLSAAGGKEALGLATAHQDVRLIITDINMPDMNGLMFVERLSATLNQASLPRVIFLTAYPSVDVAVSALRLGAADFLIKPVRPAQLLSIVKQVIEQAPGKVREAPCDGVPAQSQRHSPTATSGETMLPDVSGRALLGIDELRNLRRSHPLLCELDDTACDLLLELMRAERAGQRLSVSALSISIDAERASSATALRRIHNLVSAGHVARDPDPMDARRDFVALAPQTRVALGTYLQQVAKAFAAVAYEP